MLLFSILSLFFSLCKPTSAISESFNKLLSATDLQDHTCRPHKGLWSHMAGGPSIPARHHALGIRGMYFLGVLLFWLLTVLSHFSLFSATRLPTQNLVLCQGPLSPFSSHSQASPPPFVLVDLLRVPYSTSLKTNCLPDASHLLKWHCGRNRTWNYYQ